MRAARGYSRKNKLVSLVDIGRASAKRANLNVTEAESSTIRRAQ
jgi:hypothetical protein